jgi:hypothetical protein
MKSLIIIKLFIIFQILNKFSESKELVALNKDNFEFEKRKH